MHLSLSSSLDYTFHMPHTLTHTHTSWHCLRSIFGHLSLGPNWISSSNCRAAAIIFWFECMGNLCKKKKRKKHYIKIASNQQQHKSNPNEQMKKEENEAKKNNNFISWCPKKKWKITLCCSSSSNNNNFHPETQTHFSRSPRRARKKVSTRPNSWARRKKVKNEQANEWQRERESETRLPSCAYEQRVRKLFVSPRMQQRRRQSRWQRSSLMGQTVR